MKVLLDACVWGGAREVLVAAAHEVEAVADWPGDPGDDEILSHAFQHSQSLITLDKDFGRSRDLCVRRAFGIDKPGEKR